MPAWLVGAIGVYAVMSVAAAALYALDKRRASAGRGRRIPERTLHTIEALGGWPGAILARRTLRHKSAKASFLVVSWLIVATHAAAWAGVVWLRSR